MATSVFVAMAQSMLLKFLLFLRILILDSTLWSSLEEVSEGVSGQDITVAIEATPERDDYMVGESLTLMCVPTPQPAGTNLVSYLWECDGCFANGTTMPTITRILNDMDGNSMIDCSVTIDGNVTMSDMTFDLQVTRAPSPSITFEPPSPIREMVGNLFTVECRVLTVLGVSSVMINWTAPEGDTIVNNTRMTINPTISNGITYTSSLQFTYLIEGDEGNYTCNWMILESSGSQSVELQLAIPTPTISVTAPTNQTVGQSLALQCEVTTVRGITSRVDIVWREGDRVLNRTNSTTATTMNNSLVYTNSYTISRLSTNDDGRVIQCEVVINASPSVTDSGVVTLDITVPAFIVIVEPRSVLTVGDEAIIDCTVSTDSGVELSSIMISWMGPGGAFTNTNGRVSIGSVTDDGNNMYTRSLQFTYLMEGDEGTYTCNVMILDTNGSQSLVLSSMNFTVPEPALSIRTVNTPVLGEPLTMECNATVVRGVTSRLNFTWSSDNTTVRTAEGTSSSVNPLIYIDNYTTGILNESDIGVVYYCTASLDNEQGTMATVNITLDESIIPTPNVNVTAPNNQTVGQSLTLQCEATIVRGITSRVDIVWSSGGTELQRMNVSSTMTNNSLVYTDSYTISLLSTTDDGNVIQCEVVINTSPPVMANGDITLNVMVPTPNVTISPPGPTLGAMVGSPQDINCTVSTVSGVESSLVIISWMGPGVTITNDSRVTISPTTFDGSNYISSLSFKYLAEEDEGTYMCSVTILDTRGSESIAMSLTIPPPTVSVTAPSNQTVGQSLTLQCDVTAVRGITSRVDIVWSSSGTELQRTNVSSTMMNNSLAYTNSYTISQLSTNDQGTVYWCRVEINSIPVVADNDSIALNVTVPEPLIVIVPSGSGSFSGLDYSLTCTVTVAPGVSSSLVMVNWDRQNFVSPSSNISDISINGLEYTRTITFSPLFRNDGGQYTCSASVNGFSEASASLSTMVVVNAPVTLTLTPPEIIDDAGDDIDLLCEADEEDCVSADYMFAWWFNDDPVNRSDTRIDIMDSDMNSTIFISNTTGTDSGNYTCQLTLTVADRDNFTLSESAIVVLSAMEPPLVPVVTNVITTPSSANISWIVQIIVNDMESYTVLYGTNMSSLTNSSEVIFGSNDSSTINEMFTVNIDGLMPFTTYYFIVSANNSVNTTSTAVMNFTTDETAPGIAPQSFTDIVVTATSITFQWDNLTRRQANGIVRNFTINCTADNSSVTIVNGMSTTGTVGDLNPFTEYSCSVFAFTVLPGPASDPPIEVTTNQSASNPPVINSIVDINSSTVRVTWTRPTMPNGIITTYTVTYNNSMSMTVPYNGENTQFYDITGLSPYQLVTVTITATNGGGTSDLSKEESGRSSEAIPGVIELETDQNTIIWSPPLQPNGIIIDYQVIYSIYQNDSSRTSEKLSNNTTRYTIEGLNPGIPYEVVVVAFTSVGRGEVNNREVFFSEELTPSKAPENVTSERVNSTSVNISWIPLTLFEAQGFPEYTVTLAEMMDSNTRKKRQTNSITTTGSFAIFNGLDENTVYTAVVGVRTAGNPSTMMVTDPVTVSPPNATASPTPTTSPTSTPTPTTTPTPTPSAGPADDDDDGANGGAIAGGVIAAIIVVTVIVIVVVIIVLRVRKRTKSYTIVASEATFVNKGVDSPTQSGTARDIAMQNIDPKLDQRLEPIPLRDFSEHVANMHKDRDLGFEEEYSTISTETQASYDASQLPANIIKNRYANIFPYDFSRVKISQVDLKEDDTDYINATSIDGYKKPGAYIAAQGPLPETVKDFWQMVWDQKSPIIVMVTKTIEADVQKCEQYWPDKVGESIQPKPSLSVTLTQIQHFADYELRTMTVTEVSENEKDESNVPLEVKHFFFTSWPDHGVPQFATALISFIKRIRQSQPKDGTAPLIVHCSAGVGRTGTYITLDTMLERIKDVDNVSVYDCVRKLRTRRVFMVQTQAQYIFIHDALEELITCGDTSFNVQSMRVKVNRMGKVNPDTEITGFQEQFQLLEKVSRKPTATDCADAQHPANNSKNRFEKILPYDASRVILKAALNQPGTDYINASRIDGYKERHAFITTQCPLDNTIGDFWRMIWENKSAVIVLLCNPKHDEKNFTRFWPADTEEHGAVKVTQKSQAEKTGYMQYKFSVMGPALSVGLEPEPLQVTMLHYASWPDEEKPNDNPGLLAVTKDALELQRNTGNRAMTVVCSDGCGRSGTFIAIYYTIERLKVEGVVDIFQAIKNSRLNRANLVSNAKQYESCHEVVQEFLDEFEQYANFK